MSKCCSTIAYAPVFEPCPTPPRRLLSGRIHETSAASPQGTRQKQTKTTTQASHQSPSTDGPQPARRFINCDKISGNWLNALPSAPGPWPCQNAVPCPNRYTQVKLFTPASALLLHLVQCRFTKHSLERHHDLHEALDESTHHLSLLHPLPPCRSSPSRTWLVQVTSCSTSSAS